MKRTLCVLLLVVLLFGMIPVEGRAAENVETVVHFEDGSYLVIGEVVSKSTRASGNVNGSKPSTYYGSDGSAQWKAVLTGSYSYTGSSATCTSSSMNVTIYDSDWYVISKSASKSGDTATGSAVMGLKNAGVTVTRVPVSLTLKCDANGNLS